MPWYASELSGPARLATLAARSPARPGQSGCASGRPRWAPVGDSDARPGQARSAWRAPRRRTDPGRPAPGGPCHRKGVDPAEPPARQMDPPQAHDSDGRGAPARRPQPGLARGRGGGGEAHAAHRRGGDCAPPRDDSDGPARARCVQCRCPHQDDSDGPCRRCGYAAGGARGLRAVAGARSSPRPASESPFRGDACRVYRRARSPRRRSLAMLAATPVLACRPTPVLAEPPLS